MKTIQVTVPDPMYDFLKNQTLREDEKRLQLALMLYPYIKNETISFGYAADLIGMNRLDFIELYGSIGIPYFDMTAEELDEEIKMAKDEVMAGAASFLTSWKKEAEERKILAKEAYEDGFKEGIRQLLRKDMKAKDIADLFEMKLSDVEEIGRGKA